jgi:hypothetical protein
MSAPQERTGWSINGSSIASPECLEAIEHAFEGSSLIVEHHFYFGGRAPSASVIEDFEDFMEYLRTTVRPGDLIWCWRYNDLCRDDNSVTHGEYPDEHGLVPDGGAY